MDFNWYIVKTFPGYEQKAADRLSRQIKIENMQDLVKEVYIPIQKKYKFVRNKISPKEEIIFPGYIFVKMDLTDEAFMFVRGIQHVTGYSGITSMKQRPNPMTNVEFDQMKETAAIILVDFEPGITIKIINNDNYANKEAVIEEINPYTESVLVKIGGLTTISLSFGEIEKK